MKIPIGRLKEYIIALETLNIDELEIHINNNHKLPETYCLFTSEEYRLVVTENDSVQKQDRYISAKFVSQPVKVATLMFNKHI